MSHPQETNSPDLANLLDRILESGTGSEKGALTGLLQSLDQYVENNRDHLDRQLLHFLERRSYSKAREYIGKQTAS